MVGRRESIDTVRTGLRALIVGNDRYRRVLSDSLDIGITELLVVSYVFNYGPQTARQIADYLGVTTGTTTAILDRTERVGFVVRSPNPDDRRSVLVTVTDAGRRAMEWSSDKTNDHILAAMQGYTREELERFAALMVAVGESLSRAGVERPASLGV